MDKVLKKAAFRGVEGPVLTIVMDGVGLAPANEANAVAAANTPTLDMLMAKYPMVKLKAHGRRSGTTRSARVRSLRRAQSWFPSRSRAAKCTRARPGSR